VNTFEKMVDTAGYYAASLPGHPDHVIIGMNSIFFSAKDSSRCLPTDTSSGHAELNWIRRQLNSCREKKMKVWFTCHIPPGVNIKSTADGMQKTGKDCPKKVKMMWKEDYNTEFLALENEYRDVITGGLAGHTHMDDFRVITDAAGKPVSFFHINPSISPIDGNNPGFQLFTYDPGTMQMLDFVTYAFGGPGDAPGPDWKKEYDFDTAYGVSALDANGFYDAAKTICSHGKKQKDYEAYYEMGSKQIKLEPWDAYACGFTHLDRAGFAGCACAKNK
ncbi:MAG TPA: hypothetical protein VFU15_10700, partial [Bacteroidia bacterium]|nr:hypothetical protein [Bacteroidia bacterium]